MTTGDPTSMLIVGGLVALSWVTSLLGRDRWRRDRSKR